MHIIICVSSAAAVLGTFSFYNLCFSANKVLAALGSKGLIRVNNKIVSSVSIFSIKVALLLHIGTNILWY